jgi:hypothetical protein
VLTDEELTDIVRDELATELANVIFSPQLQTTVHRRHARRVRVKASALGVAAVVAVAAIVIPLAASESGDSAPSSTGSDRSPIALNGSAVSLAGYETNLPAGYTATEASTEPQCSNFFVPVSLPPGPGATAPSPQDFSQLALNARGNRGCLAFGLSGNYEPPVGSPAGVKDPIAPIGSEAIAIGAYRASTYQASNSPTIAVYVQIPTKGGGDHDLIVAAQGITQPDLIAMLGKALPRQVTPSAASAGPLMVIGNHRDFIRIYPGTTRR